jgi:hypothetical protein
LYALVGETLRVPSAFVGGVLDDPAHLEQRDELRHLCAADSQRGEIVQVQSAACAQQVSPVIEVGQAKPRSVVAER